MNDKTAPPPGKVWLVGAGPGDPDLLTVKAARLIGEGDVIVHDHLVGDGVLELARADAGRVYVGKRAARTVKSGVLAHAVQVPARTALVFTCSKNLVRV